MNRRNPDARRLLALAATALAVTLPSAVRAEGSAADSTAAPAAAEAPATAPAEPSGPEGTTPSPLAAPADDLSYHREQYQYAGSGLRDPFASLVSGSFVSDEEKRLPDVGSIDLLGVIWGDSDKFAMVEDREGNGFVLRVGDPVVNGEVAGITRESLTIRQHFFGTSTTVTLKLKPREEKGHAGKARR